jgi:hypothetical protein
VHRMMEAAVHLCFSILEQAKPGRFMTESRALRIARMRDAIKRKRSRLHLMQNTKRHPPEQRQVEAEATIQTLTEEINTSAEELHQLEVQLIRESLQS